MSRIRVPRSLVIGRLPVIAACFLCCFSSPGWAIVNRVVETFSTTTYKDEANTTADWNTTVGRLQFGLFQPSLLSTFDTGLALDVVVAGRLAYVADEAGGVLTVNVSNPASPFLSGSYDTPGLARGLALSGTTLFVADDASGLSILNVQFSGNPTLVGSFNTAGIAHDVAVSGTTAYVADGANGLVILDINVPGTPTLLATFPTSDAATGVEVRGTTAYVAAGVAGLQVINVSNPGSPTLLGSYNTPGSAQGVDVWGKYAYVADRASGVQIVDMSIASSPSLAGSYDTPGDAWSVIVSGTEAYVGDQSAGLSVLNVENPSAPSLRLTLDTAGNASGIAVGANLAFVADGSPGLRVVSVRSTVATPTEAGFADTPDYARRIAVVGNIAYVADDDASGLQLIDISNPSAPVAVGSYNTPGTAYDVFVSGTRAYVADGPAGLIILDVSDPANPAFLGSWDTPGTAMGISVSGTVAYIADGNNGVQVVNCSNPASPFFVTSVGVPNISSGIVVAGRTVFVAHGAQGLRTFNINTNGNLQFLGNVSTPGNANHVAVVGSTAYVADGDLQVIDVTNLNSPFIMATHPTPGDAQGVAAVGTLVVVADGNSGMRLFDVSLGSPTLISVYDTPGSSQGVAMVGSMAFMADGDAGLRILNVLQDQFNLTGNLGQSLALDATVDNVLYARLTASAVNTTWQLTGNGGLNWVPATPGGPWMSLTAGSDVRWRAIIAASPSAPATAGVSDVTVEWLYAFPVIQTISDVGHDQGRQVRITWMRSATDFVGATPQIVEYAIYRRIDSGFKPDLSTSSIDILGAAAAGWDYVTTVPAEAEDEYSVVVPTLGDSTVSEGQHWTAFRVRARTATPGEFFDSYPDSGYSLDNLAPGAPNGVVVAYHTNGANALDWTDSPSTDFAYFKVYRSTDPDFVPEQVSLVATTAVSSWIDPDYDLPGVFYKVSAVDHAGNESLAASPVATTAVGATPPPGQWKLGAAQPNPFRGATSLLLEVPESGANAQVRVIGIDGRIVRTLIRGVETPGIQAVAWDGRDDFGRNVPAGVYLVRLEAGGFSAMRKVLLVR